MSNKHVILQLFFGRLRHRLPVLRVQPLHLVRQIPRQPVVEHFRDVAQQTLLDDSVAHEVRHEILGLGQAVRVANHLRPRRLRVVILVYPSHHHTTPTIVAHDPERELAVLLLHDADLHLLDRVLILTSLLHTYRLLALIARLLVVSVEHDHQLHLTHPPSPHLLTARLHATRVLALVAQHQRGVRALQLRTLRALVRDTRVLAALDRRAPHVRRPRGTLNLLHHHRGTQRAATEPAMPAQRAQCAVMGDHSMNLAHWRRDLNVCICRLLPRALGSERHAGGSHVGGGVGRVRRRRRWRFRVRQFDQRTRFGLLGEGI